MNDSKDKKIDSLLIKSGKYCDFYRSNRNQSEYPSGLLEVATDAAERGRLTELKAISKELDIRIRDIFSPTEVLSLIGIMNSAAVSPNDIPKHPTEKRILAILRNRRISSESECDFVRLFLSDSPPIKLPKVKLLRLGAIFDKYTMS